jgi:hypothetical protein
MTPYLTGLAISSISDGRSTQAWMIAVLTRTNKMPKLDDLLNNKSGKRKMEQGLKSVLSGLKPQGKKKT